MAEYLLLLNVTDDEASAVNPERSKEHAEFAQQHGAALRGGNRLRPADTATSVRRNDAGEPVVTDGPFYETKEVLAGYYLVEAADLDEAIAIAKDVPCGAGGGIEVRPIWPMNE
ncbi:MAG: hypothetical protein J2O49_02780 [Sciscionella sp.]|nr:hypothetical protein [Sciscionella sp.]